MYTKKIETILNKLIPGKTKVLLPNEYGYRLLIELDKETQTLKVDGIDSVLTMDDILGYSNLDKVKLYPTIDDKYAYDLEGNVFKKESGEKVLIGKIAKPPVRTAFTQFIKKYETNL